MIICVVFPISHPTPFRQKIFRGWRGRQFVLQLRKINRGIFLEARPIRYPFVHRVDLARQLWRACC